MSTSADEVAGWRRHQGLPALSEVFRSVPVDGRGLLRRLFAFIGPGYLVAIGYMDPGNWATSLAGGSAFGYQLLSVVLLSNLMAVILQSLCARLAIATGRDLARACRDAMPRPVSFVLWLLAELAILATDLAEVIGTAIGLQLLFGLPLAWGVVVTSLDVMLVLALQALGFRWIEALIVGLIGVVAACFGIQMVLAQPEWAAVAGGFIPSTALVADPKMLFIALGIIGATVMPHNLYLHSAIVQTRRIGPSPAERREALTFATVDSTLALTIALFVNAAILVLAAATFHAHGQTDVQDLYQAEALLAPLIGSLAPLLFGVALLCCGLSSTITATLAGQAVMEGFLEIRLAPWVRRLLTRLIAVVPAAVVAVLYGEKGTGELLIISQVVLSFQLPFAVTPLVLFTASRRKMGDLTSPLWLTATAGIIAVVIVGLNLKLVADALF